MTLTKASEQQVEKLAAQSQESFLDNLTGAFFRRIDWWAFWIVSLVTLAVYVHTLAPTVTLEDSGELAVASDYLGVPHPPGYPIWTLITWFFQWIFHWVTYNGHPNPAWSVGLASAVAGAGACGLLALLISRSGADLLRSVPALTERIGFRVENGLCLVAGISGGLLLAFSPVLWSQSVIVEVYSLNALFQMAVLLLIYMWMCRPKNDVLLFVAAFLFGLGLTNHQTLLFLGLALGVAVLLKDVDLFRDFALAALPIGVAFIVAAKGISLFAPEEAFKDLAGANVALWKWSEGPDTPAFWVYNYLFLAVPVALLIGTVTKGRKPSIRAAYAVISAAAIYLLVVAGYAFLRRKRPRRHLIHAVAMERGVADLTRARHPLAVWVWGRRGRGSALFCCCVFCCCCRFRWRFCRRRMRDRQREYSAGGAGRGVLHVPAHCFRAEPADELGLRAHVGWFYARGDSWAVRGDCANGYFQRQVFAATGGVSHGLARAVFTAGGGVGFPAFLRVGRDGRPAAAFGVSGGDGADAGFDGADCAGNGHGLAVDGKTVSPAHRVDYVAGGVGAADADRAAD